jgi:uncharacterized membrane protein
VATAVRVDPFPPVAMGYPRRLAGAVARRSGGAFVIAADWQREVAGVMGTDETTISGRLRVEPVLVVVALLLLVLARAIRWFVAFWAGAAALAAIARVGGRGRRRTAGRLGRDNPRR